MGVSSVFASAFILAGLFSQSAAGAESTVPPPPSSTILIAGMLGEKHAYGCGVIVGSTGQTISILTAAHNLRIEQARYLLPTGESLTVTTNSAIDGHDLALVTSKRPTGQFSVASFAPPPPIGARVHLWGPIADLPFTPQAGAIAAIDPRAKDVPAGAFAIDCAACGHGDSGTGVYDESDRLIGVVTSGYFAGAQKLFVLVETYTFGAQASTGQLDIR